MKELKTISKPTLIAFMTFVLSLFCFSCSCFAEQPQTITISKQKYNEALSLLDEQNSQLILLSDKIKMLKLTSPQLVEQLTECQNRLTEADNKLKQSQEKLQNSQELLTNAEDEIFELKLSLKKLKCDIEIERSRVKRKSTQKAFYGVLGGFLVGYFSAK